MRAIVARQYGSLEDVALANISEPTHQEGEVLVEVKATSINPLDLKLISGTMQSYFPLQTPFVVGTDFSGIVAENSGLFEKGQRVYGRIEPLPVDGNKFGRTGALAERISVSAASIAPMPKSLSFAKAAALPTAAGTAWQAVMEMGKLQKGQAVLIHAGGGGVGGFAVQFARRAGARVFATASKEKVDYVRSLGADVVIDYREQNFVEVAQGIELLLDTIGGRIQEDSFSSMNAEEYAAEVRAVRSASAPA